MKTECFCILVELSFFLLIQLSNCLSKDFIEEIKNDRHSNSTRFKRFAYDHPCRNHLVITNPDRRISNTLSADVSAIRDNYIMPGWYRFTGPAGNKMPTTAPALNSCGTKWPIWFKGSHPENVGQIIYGKACLHYNNNQCFRDWEMQVANCDSYFVYRLNVSPMDESAYCAGLESLCPEGTNSFNGYTPGCVDTFPPLNGKAKMKVAHREDVMVFNCDYQGRVPGDSLLHVQWFVEGDKGTNPYLPVWSDVMMERKRSQLTSGRWNNKLGSTVYCTVSATFRSEEGVPSPPVYSDKHFLGIKVYNESLTVSEALEAGEIHIQSTVPILCMEEYERVCKIHVELEYDAESEEHTQVVFGDCSIELTPENWHKVQKIKVKAVRDFYEDGIKEKIIRFKKISTTVASEIWNDYQVPDIKVYSSNGKTGLCTSHGDPHMLTFDQLMYHAYKEGEFVLYESTKYPIKIHSRMQKCATATCNCAVAVAVQDDIVVVDRCTRVPKNYASGSSFPLGWNTIHAHAIEQGGNFAKGLHIYEHDDGRKYTIHLPTGAFIQFEIMEQWVNIYIHASSDDFNSTRGLCGTFDGVKRNDFLLSNGSFLTPMEGEACGHHSETCSFIQSWKVPEEDSLFQPKVNIKWHESQILRQESFCVCKGNTITCDYQKDIFNSEALTEQKRGKEVTNDVKIWDQSHLNRRMKRSIVEIENDKHINYFSDDYFNSQFVFNDSFTGENTGKIEEREARRVCSEAFNSNYLSKYVHILAEADILALKNSCLIDLQVTGSTEWVQMSVNSLISKATSEMYKKRRNNKDEILSDVCPQACSNHGRCRNGTCMCSSGWTGSACSVDLSASPYNVRLPNEGLCDKEVSTCDNIKVFGKRFKAQDNITCTIKRLEGLADENVLEKYFVKGKFVNFEQILIPLKTSPQVVDVFDVEISINEHFNFTDLNKFVVYSSKCLDCFKQDNHVNCTPKENTCLIDSECYESYESSENDCCLICNPEKSTTAFVPRDPSTNNLRTISKHLKMNDSIAQFVPLPPFKCIEYVKVTRNSSCRNYVEQYLNDETTNEIVFVSNPGQEFSCDTEARVQDQCSNLDFTYHLKLTSEGKDEEDDCSKKPKDRELVQYWFVEKGLQNRQIRHEYNLTPESTFKIELPRNVLGEVDYISISKTGLISYNVQEGHILDYIIVTLTHRCGNTEMFKIQIQD